MENLNKRVYDFNTMYDIIMNLNKKSFFGVSGHLKEYPKKIKIRPIPKKERKI